jgi:Domain of unknown function (DUF6456)
MNSPAVSADRLSRRQEERVARVLAALSFPGRCLTACDGTGSDRYELLLNGERAPRLVADAGLIEAMLRRDWLRRAGRAVVASEAGCAWLRRHTAGDDGWRSQHLAAETVEIEAPDGGRATATVVANESPLAWLRRRRGANGQPLVSDVQFAAGERLRTDFERGRLGPRVTADWTRPPMGRQRGGPGGGATDLAVSALAARRRVEDVLKALGPDLGSLLIDVCCFLTGLEDAERRRTWPRRSAKVVLSIALDRLAAHYGLSQSARGPDRSGALRHWGDDDYRPVAD